MAQVSNLESARLHEPPRKNIQYGKKGEGMNRAVLVLDFSTFMSIRGYPKLPSDYVPLFQGTSSLPRYRFTQIPAVTHRRNPRLVTSGLS